MDKQRVCFRKWKSDGNVIAFFLDQPEGPGHCLSYERVGQHGEASYPHPQTEPAEAHEYQSLYAELVRLGYSNLRVVKRGRIAR
jgi:hypothetical protein